MTTRKRPAKKAAESFVHVEPRAFNAALLRVSRFAHRDGVLPALNGIQVERTKAGVALVATDRFTLGAETLATPLAEPDDAVAGSAFIPLPSLPLVKAVLESARAHSRVPFNLTTGTLADVPVANPTMQFPEWRKIVRTCAERPAVVDQVVDFNPGHLLKFERSYGNRSGMRVRFTGTGNPIVITAVNFIGIMMPIKADPDETAMELVLRDLEVAA